MRLLPSNSSLKDQRFAELLDTTSKVNYSDFKINPLTCDASLLPHIALVKGANIENLKEQEARLYLNTFTKKSIGTAGAVEDAINSFFNNAKLIEWFEDKENLKRGMFKVEVNLKDDKSCVYGEREFTLSSRLINSSKNHRSKLDSFDIKISSLGDINYTARSITDLQLSNELIFKKSITKFFLMAQNTTTINLSKEIKPFLAIGSFRDSGASVSTINLQNNSNLISSSKGQIKIASGGVINIKMTNKQTYKNESEVNLNITGGVTWNI